MPFLETCRMEERVRMMLDYDTGNGAFRSCASATGSVEMRSMSGAGAETVVSRIGSWIARMRPRIVRIGRMRNRPQR